MILSRAEICAAIVAYRAAGRSLQTAPVTCDAPSRARLAEALLEECAEIVIDGPTYRSSLVTRLHRSVLAGTYRAPADAIVDQLLGRLVAAKLPN